MPRIDHVPGSFPAPADPGTLAAQASAAYLDGDFEQCRSLANRIITATPGDPHGLHLLMASALQLRRGKELVAIANHAQAVTGSAVALLAAVLRSQLQAAEYRAIVFAHDALPRDHGCWIVAKYYRGCVEIAQGHHDDALRHFTEFRRALPAYAGIIDFFDGGAFNMMFRQGVTVGDQATVEARITRAVPEHDWPAPLVMVQPATDRAGVRSPGPVFFASCNGIYFDHFARPFLAALARLPEPRPVHLHVIEPTAESMAAFPGLAADAGVAVGLSTEAAGRYSSCTYFACSRFFVAPRLIEAYGGPVVSLDIDIAIRPEIQRLYGLESTLDFACFNTGRTEPASVYQASVMVFTATPNGRAFIDGLQRYCLPKLGQPDAVNWMLDQAALISVRNGFDRRNRGLRFLELDRALGLDLAQVCEPIAHEDEKQAMKYRIRCSQRQAATDFLWSPD
jgi:hypothetical protein